MSLVDSRYLIVEFFLFDAFQLGAKELSLQNELLYVFLQSIHVYKKLFEKVDMIFSISRTEIFF